MFFHHGVVAFRIFAADDKVAALNDAPAVLFKPHPFASFQAVQFPTRFLLRLVFPGAFEHPLGVGEGFHRSLCLVFLLSCGFKIALSVLVDACVEVQLNLRAVWLVVFIGKMNGDEALGRVGANDPRNRFDGFSYATPSVPLHRLAGLLHEGFHVVPMFLNQMTEVLLFLDFFRERPQRFLLLSLAALKTFDLR